VMMTHAPRRRWERWVALDESHGRQHSETDDLYSASPVTAGRGKESLAADYADARR
jgi:hypothetical protein